MEKQTTLLILLLGARIVTSAPEAWKNTGAYVDIEGFEITSSVTNTKAGIHAQGMYSRAIGNHIHHFAAPSGTCPSGGGILMGGGAAYQEAIGNVTHHIGPPPGRCNKIHGIYTTVAHCRLVNNISFSNAGRGIQLWGKNRLRRL